MDEGIAAEQDASDRAGAAHPGGLERCDGVTVDPAAPVISRASAVIDAPVDVIWRLHADVDSWSTWIPEITPASTSPGPLQPGSVIDWSPQGMKVRSTLVAVDPERGTAWTGAVIDSDVEGVHLWTFRPVPGGVLATTEESWAGPSVDADVAGCQAALDEGLAEWVERLKVTAEAVVARRDGSR